MNCANRRPALGILLDGCTVDHAVGHSAVEFVPKGAGLLLDAVHHGAYAGRAHDGIAIGVLSGTGSRTATIGTRLTVRTAVRMNVNFIAPPGITRQYSRRCFVSG